MTPSHFLNELGVTLKPDTDNIWVLYSPLEYWSAEFGLIIVPSRFETDFASVPRLPIIYNLWGDRMHREAVLHDYLFRKDSKLNLSFMECNYVFLEAMKSRNVSWHVRIPMYLGVCVGGYFSYHSRFVGDSL